MGWLSSALTKKDWSLGMTYKLVKLSFKLLHAPNMLYVVECMASRFVAERSVKAVLYWHTFRWLEGKVHTALLSSEAMHLVNTFQRDKQVRDRQREQGLANGANGPSSAVPPAQQPQSISAQQEDDDDTWLEAEFDFVILNEVLTSMPPPRSSRAYMIQAGLLFLRECMIKASAGEESLQRKFQRNGVFRCRACLDAFFGTRGAKKMAKFLQGSTYCTADLTSPEMRYKLLPYVNDTWRESRVALRNEVLNLFVL